MQEWRNRNDIDALSDEQKMHKLTAAYNAVGRTDMTNIIRDIVKKARKE